MAHYAKIEEGVITKIIVADDNFFNDFIDDTPGDWVETRKGMDGGILWTNSEVDADQSKGFRKNFAVIGGTYDKDRDAFIPPKFYDSWVLNEDTCRWAAPVEKPDSDGEYRWDEEAYQVDNTTGWVAL